MRFSVGGVVPRIGYQVPLERSLSGALMPELRWMGQRPSFPSLVAKYPQNVRPVFASDVIAPDGLTIECGGEAR
jgi:hypothetical protein